MYEPGGGGAVVGVAPVDDVGGCAVPDSGPKNGNTYIY